METIILKIILCSGIVLGLYYGFLAREKTFIFNRFYLILGLIFSYSIPFITVETKQIEKEKPSLLIQQPVEPNIIHNPIPAEQTFDYPQLILTVYFIITGLLIIKMSYSLIKIKSLKGKKMIYHNRTLILLKKETAPFSFWNTIYLSENYFKNGKMDDRIFLHEEIHVKQRHTLDVLFTETLLTFSWFNPFIYFYRNAIKTNHEFIADGEVITRNKDIKNYQELILDEALKQQNLSLIHQFNFNNTKKRFLMMTQKNSKFAKAKRYCAIPAFALLTAAFVGKVYAHDALPKNIGNSKSMINASAKEPYSEFKQILKKYSPLLDNKQYAAFEKTLTDSDRAKLSETYHQLTDRQKSETALYFFNTKDKLFNDFKEKAYATGQDTIPPKKSIDADIKVSSKNKDQHPSLPPPPPPSADFIQADYPGGINVLRNKVAQNFNGSVFQGNEGTLKAVTYIAIDENGTVDKVIATGENAIFNNEVERTVKYALADTKWEPATNEGKQVRTTFSLPITMTFESAKKTQ